MASLAMPTTARSHSSLSRSSAVRAAANVSSSPRFSSLVTRPRRAKTASAPKRRKMQPELRPLRKSIRPNSCATSARISIEIAWVSRMILRKPRSKS